METLEIELDEVLKSRVENISGSILELTLEKSIIQDAIKSKDQSQRGVVCISSSCLVILLQYAANMREDFVLEFLEKLKEGETIDVFDFINENHARVLSTIQNSIMKAEQDDSF